MTGATVSILVYEGVALLDACGPFEVFTVAGQVDADGPTARFPIHTVAAGAQRDVSAQGGLRLTASHTLRDAPVADIVIVPGGDLGDVEKQQTLHEWLHVQRDTAEVLAAVSTGAFVLAEANLLTARVTTHREAMDQLRSRFPGLDPEDDERFVDQGGTATSAGGSAGIDLSLHLVARFAGRSLAVATARRMDYPWRPDEGETLPPLAGEGLF